MEKELVSSNSWICLTRVGDRLRRVCGCTIDRLVDGERKIQSVKYPLENQNDGTRFNL